MPAKGEHLDPERSLGYQVRRCHRRFDRLLNSHLGRHNLKTGFWYYLRVLWLKDGITQKQLSDLTNVTENTTAATINGMVEQGLIQRVKDSTDRRKLNVSLTEKGRALEGQLIQYAIDINDIAAVGISREELDICASVLNRMSANLQAAFENQFGRNIEES